MKYLLVALIILVSIPGCSLRGDKVFQAGSSSPLINLLESTRIVRELIVQNKLISILDDHDPERLTLLLDNVSPAKMAFEVEVFASKVQPVVVYYFEDSEQSKEYIKHLEQLAITYENRVKFVTVDADKLFALADDAEIEALPAILIIKDRDIVEAYDGGLSIEQLEQVLTVYGLHTK